ncbi:MAG: sigma-70 family RNA polymerase sigma factor [Gemmatimonadota bacterium]|nr:sigma-70 family RNA polymerase sigma factor [Gemmatimonadota bacterium]
MEGPRSGDAPPAGEKRDRDAEFEREALPHLDALYGLALRLTGGDEARSHDLVQEAMLKAYRAWDDYELGTNCRAWLMTILRNTFINEFRSKQRRPTPVEFEEVAERSVFPELRDTDPEGRFFERIVDEEVVEAIQDLPEAFRVPLVLSDVEGLSYQEIAEAMDIPVGTVKSRLFRARRRLQRELYAYAREMGYIR